MNSHPAFLFLLSIAILAIIPSPIQALDMNDVPPNLARWEDWVLYGHDTAFCPGRFDDGTSTRCQWPSRLQFNITEDGAVFIQHWRIFAPGWVPLPGDGNLWPQGVTLDGKSTVVILQDQRPSLWMDEGEHHVEGRFFWKEVPELIPFPPSLGLVSLFHNDEPVATPPFDDQNRLWLAQGQITQTRENRSVVKVFRLIRDTIPIQVTTRLHIDIFGESREIEFSDILLDGSIPMVLDSPLPARLDGQNRLKLQARPGRWVINIRSRLTGPRSSINAGALSHGDEIWSFEPQNHLRLVEIQNVTAVEPSRTEIPVQWQHFSAYLVTNGDVMKFKEIRRGNPDPPPDQLTLNRTWWLDFSGNGFTVHDNITGTLSRQWFLIMNPPLSLGRVSVGGQDSVITSQGPEKKPGVELRAGQLRLQADARLTRTSGPIAVIGWDHDFQSVSGKLNLPPGWRLLSAAGVDHASSTWLQSWTLLDFFLVLIIALGILKIRGWKWGLVALVLMVLIFHESGAPRLIWLHILAVFALLPLLPKGWLKRCVGLWGICAAAVLLVQAVPFSVNQIRWGVYPQLAPHDSWMDTEGIRSGIFDMEKRSYEEALEEEPPIQAEPRMAAKQPSSRPAPVEMKPSLPKVFLADREPDALIPTGPGLPQWHWQTIDLSWSGPLARNQTMRLFLLSPLVNLVLAFLRVGLLILLIVGLVEWRPWWNKLQTHLNSAILILVLAVVVGGTCVVRAEDVGTGYPSQHLLEELRQRLLEKPDCLPSCADIPHMEITLSGDQLQIMLKVHAALQTAIPLPANRTVWMPSQVLLDNAPISGLARESDGQLWAVIPDGVHTLILLGQTKNQDVIQLPLRLNPHSVSVTAPQWEIRGMLPDGRLAATLQFIRSQRDTAYGNSMRVQGLMPFFQVERDLALGLSWQVVTRIRRLTPPDMAAVAAIPLLAGESITTPGVQVEEGKALIHFSPDQSIHTYTGTIPISSRIELTAPRAVPWTEVWRLTASPIWHCETSGIAAIHHLNRSGRWQPQWQPWPGESVVLHISRPAAVSGQTKTIDSADLVITPGRRFTASLLTINMRSSQGGQYTVTLPESANLQSVNLNGNDLPIRQEGRLVAIPLEPGAQKIEVGWHKAVPFSAWYRSPRIDLGQEAVNARVSLNIPESRWILFTTGPRWGPAVLFWSYLVVLLIIACALGRITITPIKTWQWLLLTLGLTQIPAGFAIVVVGWIIGLGIRRRLDPPGHWLAFNLIQAGLIILTIAALLCLFSAVSSGLVGQPKMQITGNDSSYLSLLWTQDRVGSLMPQPRVFTLSVWYYRGLMLAWSLWLALSLIQWFKWGWLCFSQGGIWQRIRIHRTEPATEPKLGDSTPSP